METSKAPVCHPYYKKFTKADHINSQAKQVILNVFFHLSSLNPQKSWNMVAKEASALTGVCPTTIFRLKNEKQMSVLQEKTTCDSLPQCDVNPENPDAMMRCDENPDQIGMRNPIQNAVAPRTVKRNEKGNESPRSWKRTKTKAKKRKERFDEATYSAIRYKLEEISHRIEAPSVNKFLDAINSDPNLPNFKRTTFHTILKELGFSRFLKKPRGIKKPNGQKAVMKKKPSPPPPAPPPPPPPPPPMVDQSMQFKRSLEWMKYGNRLN